MGRSAELVTEMLRERWGDGEKVRAFLLVMATTLNVALIRMACIQAASRLSHRVSEQDLVWACRDLGEFLDASIRYVCDKVDGFRDYGESYGGAKGKNRQCLCELEERGAISLEASGITIAEYVQTVAEVFGVKEAQARNHGWSLRMVSCMVKFMQHPLVWRELQLGFHPGKQEFRYGG